MRPGRAVEGADATGVWPGAALIACDRDKSITWTSRHVSDNRAGHSRIGLVVNGPVRPVESHQTCCRARSRCRRSESAFYIEYIGARQWRIARVV